MTMFGAFRGKLFSAGYWSNVAASWSSYLIQLNKDDTPMFEVDEDGNVECAGDVTANGVLLGAGGAGTPGGADTEIQFNDSSAFAGDSALTWNKTTQTLAAPILDLSDKVVTPALKVTGGTPGAGKVLTSDDDGDATWAAAAAASPGGIDGQIQYNNLGAFDGATGLTWNSVTSTLGVGVSATGGVVNIASDAAQTPITITKAHDADNTVATAVLVKQNIGAAGGAATGFGSQIAWQLDTTTTDNQDAAYMSASWYDGIHATRRGQLTFGVTSYAGTETGLRIIAGDGTPNIVGGYSGNSVTGGKVGCVIGGGGGASNTNAAAENYVTIGGGYNNKASGKYCTIAGGRANTAGATNVLYSTVGGGYDNYINGASGVIIGGGNNTIASYSDFCTILGGGNNVFAEGMDHGCIAGWRTKASHAGVFLWSDSTDVDFSSFAANELAVRASGGVRFVTNAEASTVVKTFAPADVNTGNEQITITGHTFNNGDRVRFTSTATLPGGLAVDTDYWVTVVSPDVITVSKPGYTATPVNLTNGGTAGATHTATKYATTQTAISAAGVFQPGGGYNSVDGTAGMTDEIVFDDNDAVTNTVTIKNGIITAWAQA